MRHLTLAALAVVGIAAAPSAVADPVDPTPAPATSTAPSPATAADPTSSPAPATSTSPSSGAAPTSIEPTTTAATASTAAAGSHQVTYTVTTTSDLTANIYYVAGDPPNQSSANKPEYMPMARTQVGPGAPWIVQANLSDPTQWAFVSASGGLRVNPEFRCEIAVDGTVVVSQQGGSGVQCALRPW